MIYLFSNWEIIKYINLSKFFNGNVINMRDMFDNCYNLEEINLSSFNTWNDTYIRFIYSQCEIECVGYLAVADHLNQLIYLISTLKILKNCLIN